jgi:outer membrane protein OmpA-like peptidoglycan-associated protein
MKRQHYILEAKNHNVSHEEAQWISLSDLMTGLMMVFMLIAISFMVKVEADSANVKRVAVIYDKLRENLYQDLSNEFKEDLPKWGAVLDKKSLSIRFNEPDVLFDMGDAKLKSRFQEILNDFFPRYVKIITSEKYKNAIEEIRIEGHTSSMWNELVSPQEAYFKNMELSQSRTRSTLRFVLGLPRVQDNLEWLKHNMTANGLSSSKPVLNDNKTENSNKSQRVEFRIRTDAEAKITTILDKIK